MLLTPPFGVQSGESEMLTTLTILSLDQGKIYSEADRDTCSTPTVAGFVRPLAWLRRLTAIFSSHRLFGVVSVPELECDPNVVIPRSAGAKR